MGVGKPFRILTLAHTTSFPTRSPWRANPLYASMMPSCKVRRILRGSDEDYSMR